MAKIDPKEKTIIFPVAVPAGMAADLQLKAGEGLSVPELLVRIAARHADLPLDDERGFWVSSKLRARLEKAFSKAMQDPELELVPNVERLVTLRLGKVKLTLDADLIDRCTARDVAAQLQIEDYDPSEWWNEILTRALNQIADGTIS